MAVRVVLADDNFLVHQGNRGASGRGRRGRGRRPGRGAERSAPGRRRARPGRRAHRPADAPTLRQEGIEAAKEIRRRHRGTGVVVLSQYVEPDDVVDLLSDGVAGLCYLLKERVARVEELVARRTADDHCR